MKNPSEEEKRCSFYIFAVCLSIRNRLVTEASGLILKKIETERKLESIYHTLIDEIKTQAKINLADISAIEKLVSPHEFTYDFMSKIDKNRTLGGIYRRFNQWLKNIESVKKVIDCAAAYRDLFVEELT